MGGYSNMADDVATKMREDKIANMKYDIRTVLSVFSRELVRQEDLWERNNVRYAEARKAEREADDRYYKERERRRAVEEELDKTWMKLRATEQERWETRQRLKRLGSVIKAVRKAGVDVDALARKRPLVILDCRQHMVEVKDGE